MEAQILAILLNIVATNPNIGLNTEINDPAVVKYMEMACRDHYKKIKQICDKNAKVNDLGDR